MTGEATGVREQWSFELRRMKISYRQLTKQGRTSAVPGGGNTLGATLSSFSRNRTGRNSDPIAQCRGYKASRATRSLSSSIISP